MIMLKDLTKVTKARWPEMLLIIGFLAIGRFLDFQVISGVNFNIKTDPITMSEKTLFLYSMTAMIFNVLFLWLYMGFLATLNVNPYTPHEPAILIKIGRFFFWRGVRFLILFSLYWTAVSVLIFSPVRFLFFRTAESYSTTMEWAFHFCMIIAAGALAKLLLFVPPIMICKNLMVLPAVKVMSDYKLSNAKAPAIIFVAGLLVYSAITTLHMYISTNTPLFDIVTAIRSIVFATITLLIGIIGIWFVSGKRFGALQQQEDTEENNS